MVCDPVSVSFNAPPPDIISWRVHRQRDEEHRIRKEEKESAKRLKKDRERREREARSNPGPYGAYTNPMNDLERRMDNVDLGRPRNDYNSKRMGTYTKRLAFLISSADHQSRHIRALAPSPRPRPTWALGICHPKGDIHRTLTIHPPRMAPVPTYTVLPLRSAADMLATPSRPSCRAPGTLRPTLWPGEARRYTVRGRAPRHPFPVELRRMGIVPVPRRPSLVASRQLILPRALVRVLRRLFPGFPLPLTVSLAINTLMLSRGPPALAVARSLVGQSNRRRCCPHPMGSAVPRISRSRTHSSTR
jgi:hypothetical protein